MSGDDIALRMSEAGLWGYLNLFSYGLDVSGVVVGLTGALRDASSVPPPASVGVAMPLGDPQGLSVALLFDKARVSLEALTKIAEGARRPFKVEAVARGEWTALLMSRDGKAGERFGEPVAMGPGEVLRYAGNTWRCAGGALVSGDGSAAVPDGSLAAESGAYHGKGRRCLDEASRQLLRASGAAGKPTPEALKKAIFQALDCAAGDPATAAEAQAVRKLVESQALPALEHLAKVVQGSDVRLATGLGLDEVPDEVPLPVVAVSGARITVDGEQIVEVECTTESGMACTDADRNKPTNSYAIPARFKEDQSEYSFMVPSLEEALKAKLQMGEGLRKRPVQRARVAVDKYIPFRILVEVVHSMGMAGYSEIYLLVRRRGDAPGELGAIKVLIPKLGKPTPGEVDPPYNLTVLVDTKGIATKINVASISEGWGAGRMYRKLDPRGAEALPLDELYARLSAVKAGRPELGIVNLGADMHRPWHEVAAVIEATRRVLPKGAADSLEAFEAAFAAPPLERDPMFPHTVFVVAE